VGSLTALGLCLTLVHGAFAAALAMWVQPFVPFVSQDFTHTFVSLLWIVGLIDPLVFCLLIISGKALGAADRNKQLAISQTGLEAELARAQLEALRLEIQPHFLFNTLNAIASLIRVNDNPGALSMLLGLSDLMRATLDRPAGQTSPLGDELRLIAQYVSLQRARFGDRLEVTYQIDRECDGCECPVFLLQPLVENALRHGLATRSGKARLRIVAGVDGAHLCVQIADDGVGLRPDFNLDRDAGTGLRNSRSRLAHLYGDEANLTMSANADGGVTVALVFPARRSRVTELLASGAA
jgi:LytS/YehU family sensor histidine kinase